MKTIENENLFCISVRKRTLSHLGNSNLADNFDVFGSFIHNKEIRAFHDFDKLFRKGANSKYLRNTKTIEIFKRP